MKHYLGICLVLVTIAAIGFFTLYSCTRAADHTVASVRDAFVQVFRLQPQITVNQQVVLSQTAPIAELAVVTKEELVTYGFSAHIEELSIQIPLTEQQLRVSATYRLKAGFDLHEPFQVEIDPQTHQIHARMPPAKILSVEQVGDLSYQGEDSLLNRITDDERAQLLHDLNAAAHSQAEASSLKRDAEEQVQQRLQEIFQHNGQAVQMEFVPEASHT